jgi:hypothetical protein
MVSLAEDRTMNTYDLRKQTITIDDLLRLAAAEAIQVVSKDGQVFVVELADEFDREVAQLRDSAPFREFLAQRSRSKAGSLSLDELDREIDEALNQESP